MDSFTNNYDVIITLLISGILGALGQGIRVWFGLSELIYNKNFLIDDAAKSSRSGSIFIGYITGFSMVLLHLVPREFTIESIAMVIAAGYAATDIIESIFTYSNKR